MRASRMGGWEIFAIGSARPRKPGLRLSSERSYWALFCLWVKFMATRKARLKATLCAAALARALGAQAAALDPPKFEPALIEHEASEGKRGRCLGVWAGSATLAPRHCVTAGRAFVGAGESIQAQEISGSSERDYALLALPGRLPSGSPVSASSLPSGAPRAGEGVWIRLRDGWVLGKVSAVWAGGFWAIAQRCPRPGDSGAALWARREGRWEWLGMLISAPIEGEAEGACSTRLTALSVSAIAWGAHAP